MGQRNSSTSRLAKPRQGLCSNPECSTATGLKVSQPTFIFLLVVNLLSAVTLNTREFFEVDLITVIIDLQSSACLTPAGEAQGFPKAKQLEGVAAAALQTVWRPGALRKSLRLSSCLPPLMHARLVLCCAGAHSYTQQRGSTGNDPGVSSPSTVSPCTDIPRSLAWLAADVTRLLRPQPHNPLCTSCHPSLPPSPATRPSMHALLPGRTLPAWRRRRATAGVQRPAETWGSLGEPQTDRQPG